MGGTVPIVISECGAFFLRYLSLYPTLSPLPSKPYPCPPMLRPLSHLSSYLSFDLAGASQLEERESERESAAVALLEALSLLLSLSLSLSLLRASCYAKWLSIRGGGEILFMDTHTRLHSTE